MQTKVERVKQARICVALWACSYEFLNYSYVSDAKYDETCKEVERDLELDTDNKKLDYWFRREFSANTGQWVHKHPELNKLKQKAQHLIWLKENPL